ncbi:hypothetical protein BHM03_00042937 [Ensete ventricosum]|uniref:Uncharacterized protein n=1 Tax=Ensete ventricosum TaxID=4639 RepID=A0A445MKG3_ENSVE|nr:hypothetical protein BHM03_00042937 [Ensete ventricosum]
MRLPRGPYSRRILLSWSSISSSDWMVMCHNPAIPCNHQLNLGLLINLGVGVWLFFNGSQAFLCYAGCPLVESMVSMSRAIDRLWGFLRVLLL